MAPPERPANTSLSIDPVQMLRELANVRLIVILILAATFMLGRLLSLPTPPLRLFRGDYAGAPIGDPVGPLHRPSIGYVIR